MHFILQSSSIGDYDDFKSDKVPLLNDKGVIFSLDDSDDEKENNKHGLHCLTSLYPKDVKTEEINGSDTDTDFRDLLDDTDDEIDSEIESTNIYHLSKKSKYIGNSDVNVVIPALAQEKPVNYLHLTSHCSDKFSPNQNGMLKSTELDPLDRSLDSKDTDDLKTVGNNSLPTFNKELKIWMETVNADPVIASSAISVSMK